MTARTTRSRAGRRSSFPPIDYQDIHYYSAPKKKEKGPESLDEVDPELVEAFNKLGIPLAEQKALTGVAVDAVFDSVSVATTYQKQLEDLGDHLRPDLARRSRSTRSWSRSTSALSCLTLTTSTRR